MRGPGRGCLTRVATCPCCVQPRRGDASIIASLPNQDATRRSSAWRKKWSHSAAQERVGTYGSACLTRDQDVGASLRQRGSPGALAFSTHRQYAGVRWAFGRVECSGNEKWGAGTPAPHSIYRLINRLTPERRGRPGAPASRVRHPPLPGGGNSTVGTSRADGSVTSKYSRGDAPITLAVRFCGKRRM